MQNRLLFSKLTSRTPLLLFLATGTCVTLAAQAVSDLVTPLVCDFPHVCFSGPLSALVPYVYLGLSELASRAGQNWDLCWFIMKPMNGLQPEIMMRGLATLVSQL